MQERLYRLEQHAGIVSSPPPPFVPPRDPLALYDEACAAYEADVTSRPHGKGKATEEDEEYIEEEDEERGSSLAERAAAGVEAPRREREPETLFPLALAASAFSHSSLAAMMEVLFDILRSFC